MFKIKIKRINLYAEWKLNAINDFCPICKNHILDNSVFYEIKKKKSIPIIGNCNHCYHKECINLWIKNKNLCPLCNQIWKLKT